VTNTLPTHVGAGHQRTERTNTGCNQWLSLAKIALKVPLASRNRSLVANTNRCGEGIKVGLDCGEEVQRSRILGGME
jgi:hypothetical protein